MNFKVLASLTIIMFAACSTAADGDTNLAPNPSFEQAEGFVADDWKTREGIKVERITDGGRTDKACVRFSDDSVEKGTDAGKSEDCGAARWQLQGRGLASHFRFLSAGCLSELLRSQRPPH